METLITIPESQLPKLKDLYKVDWPLHITTHSTIELFIERFVKHPEWKAKVRFLSFRDDWRTTGSFVMIIENRIFFNTLESFPFNSVKKALVLTDFEDKMMFVNIRDALRPVILDIVKIHHLKVVSDIGTTCFKMPKEELLTLQLELRLVKTKVSLIK